MRAGLKALSSLGVRQEICSDNSASKFFDCLTWALEALPLHPVISGAGALLCSPFLRFPLSGHFLSSLSKAFTRSTKFSDRPFHSSVSFVCTSKASISAFCLCSRPDCLRAN